MDASSHVPVPRELVDRVLPESFEFQLEIADLNDSTVGCLKNVPKDEISFFDAQLTERGYKWTNLVCGESVCVLYHRGFDGANEAVQLTARDLGFEEPPLSLNEHAALARLHGVDEASIYIATDALRRAMLVEQGNTHQQCAYYQPDSNRQGWGECSLKGTSVEGSGSACADFKGSGGEEETESSVTEQADGVDIQITGEDTSHALLELPGFQPIPVDLDVITDWVEQRYGTFREIRPYSTVSLKVDPHELYTFLEGPGVDVNDYTLHRETGPIESSEQLAEYFASLSATRDKPRHEYSPPEEEEPPSDEIPLEREERWVVFALDGNYVSEPLPKEAAIQLKGRLESEGRRVKISMADEYEPAGDEEEFERPWLHASVSESGDVICPHCSVVMPTPSDYSVQSGEGRCSECRKPFQVVLKEEEFDDMDQGDPPGRFADMDGLDLWDRAVEVASAQRGWRRNTGFFDALAALDSGYDDFDSFFEDNPGVEEALHNWVGEQIGMNPEWEENVRNWLEQHDRDE